MSNPMKSGFGKRLREEREQLDLNQDQFAKKTGLKRVTQFLYEKEENHPNYRYLTLISELGVDMRYLFFGERTPKNSLHLTPNILKEIYCVVDEVSRDEAGQPLPLNIRLGFFSVLCASFSGRDDEHIDRGVMKIMLGK